MAVIGSNRRILIVDDNQSIHEDFRKTLSCENRAAELEDMERELFGEAQVPGPKGPEYELSFASQGLEAFELVQTRLKAGTPFSVAFVDMRMPPGWDGLETISRIMEIDEDLQFVICTAYSDHTWQEIVDQIGVTDRVLILKKPFDRIEVSQLALALAEKWDLIQEARSQRGQLEDKVQNRTKDLVASRAELMRMNSVLDEARKTAESASALKSDFLANMSHEIRTPLNGIVGMANLLRSKDLNDEQADLVDTMLDSAGSLLEIINDILDLSKVEAGCLSIESERFSLEDLLEGIQTLWRPKAREKGIELYLHIGPGVPQKLVSDATRCRQVLTNLVSNAVKFTKEGHVEIRAELELLGKGQRRVVFRVVDCGIGIEAKNRAKIFEKFHQEDSSTTRRFGGTGLGLAISHQLAGLLGGELLLERTAVNEGSTFLFSIPVRGEDKSSERRRKFQDESVLVYSEDPRHGLLTCQQLSAWGLRARSVHSLGSLSQVLAGEHGGRCSWRALIVDLECGKERIDAIWQQLHSDPRLSSLGVLLQGSTEEIGDSRDCTMGLRIPKPMRRSQSYAALAALLQQMSDEPEVTLSSTVRAIGAEIGGSGPGSTMPGEGARVLLAEDNAVNQKVASLMLKRFGCEVTIAGDGREAVDLFEARNFDLVLMDCQMPIMDGLEATERIRESEKGLQKEPTPIVALTASAMIGDKDRCMRAGMDDYLTKPLTTDSLSACLSNWTKPKNTPED